MSNTRFVYSTDGSHKRICKVCAETPCRCKKVQSVNPSEVTIKMRLEKKGRGGKTVTVLFNFPHNPEYFKKLAKNLKSQCGTGGSYKEDQVEIQGDHREKLKIILEKLGFKAVFAGG